MIGADPGDEWAADAVAGALRAARRRARPHRRRQRRDDQARLQRLPRDEDLASSTRSPTSARRSAPTSPRSPAGWASTSGSATSSCSAGIGYGGSCFPKDVSALKQLAGNSGYHFQLLNSVIEVNELQKRRVLGKLTKHLGSLVGKRIALLGLAFKPNTDDMREASSLVLSARLQGEGADVVAYDPVAPRRRRGAAALGRARRLRRGGAGGRRRGDPRHRVARVRRRSTGPPSPAIDAQPADRRRPQLPRSRGAARRRVHLRGHRARLRARTERRAAPRPAEPIERPSS